MAACERNCFCRCDGSCRGAAPLHVHVPGYAAMKPETKKAVMNMAQAAGEMVMVNHGGGVFSAFINCEPNNKPLPRLFPDHVPDFTAEACAQAKVKII